MPFYDMMGTMRKILLVESIKGKPKAGSYIFEHLHLSVDSVSTPLEAINRVHAAPYDFAIIDLELVGLNVIDLNIILRDKNSAIRIVALSDQSTPISAEEMKIRGFDDIFYKPFKLEKLLEFIN